MRRLEEIASLLPTVDSVPGLVSTVDAIVDQVVDIEHSGIYLYDTERGALVLHSAKGFTEEERRLAEESAMTRHPGQVFRTREVLLTQDVETNPQGTSSSPRSFQIRSRVYLPVMCRNHCVGVFGLASQRVNAFSDEHISFLSFLCNITGVVYSQLQAAAKHRALEEQLFHSQKMEALGRLAGGISHCKKIAAIGESYHCAVVTHNFLGPLITAASLHLDASIPNFITQEYTKGDEAPHNAVYKCSFAREGGYIPIPEAPGLGVELDEALIAATPFKPINNAATPLRLDGSVSYAV